MLFKNFYANPRVNMNFSWLNSRKYIFILSVVDLIIYFVGSRFFNLYNYSNFLKGNSAFLLMLLVIVICNYVTGRYTLENFNNIGFVIIKSITTISILCSFFYIFKLINLIEDNIFEQYRFLIIYLFCSTFSHSLLKKILLKKRIASNQWYFLGSEERYQYLDLYIKNSGKLINLEFISDGINEELLKLIKFKKAGIVVDNLNNLNEKEKSMIFNLKAEEIDINTILKWCVFELQSIPSEILNFDDILRDDLFLDINSKSSRFSSRLKRSGDFLLSIFLLVILSPILFISAIIIKLEDSGPIFYSQYRTGYKGRPFRIWKLRTMKVDSESDGAVWAKKGDPRITKIGNFLRKMRIDELPQLVSVINGQMSLIGPRPERPEFNILLAKEIKNYELRHFIKPGLSGWSQVNYPYGASIKDASIKLSYDLYYLYVFSNLLDFIIFFKTIQLVLNLRGSSPK